jgi:hypothetical protein
MIGGGLRIMKTTRELATVAAGLAGVNESNYALISGICLVQSDSTRYFHILATFGSKDAFRCSQK